MTSQLERLCESRNVRADFRFGEARKEVEWAAHNWRVTVKYRGRQLTCDFYGGSCVYNPTAADLLSSLILDTVVGDENFEDYCNEFGHDSYDPKARENYDACVRIASKTRQLLGDDFELFQNAEH